MNTQTTTSTASHPTPIEQYKNLKKKYPEAVLLFRSGSYYNVFNDDARTAAQILGITTYVENNPDEHYFWAGFASQMLDEYLPRLIRAGHRVAICDQV